MGSARITLCAAAVAAAVVSFAPAAHARDGGVSVTPASPAPGSDVALRVGDCAEKTATAVSAAFVADVRLAVTDGALVGETRIRSSLTVGTYDVTITCGSSERKSTITVVQGTGRPATPTSPSSPVAPVPAGGGGTAHLAATDAHAAGPGTAHAVTGLVLAGAAAAAVAVLSGRRRRGTG
ncbi:hypothetical protein ABZZ74_18485 [Streptomyces sp. NPDC006476]|uniref:hypothetical protein n=1 Tax=Streptomyces sp. NPDC006476 TaxID=3157175 RepID=UPI00339DB732